jgi:predicted Zn-dependent protease
MEPQIQARLRAAYGAALAALREGRAATAEHRLRAIEAQFPGEMNCLWLIGAALLDQNKIPESVQCH